MRILFAKGQQKKFISDACERLNISLYRLSKQQNLQCSYSTLKKYFRENLVISAKSANKITDISGISWKEYKIMDTLKDTWGQSKGGKIGKCVLMKKYPHKLSKWGLYAYKKANLLNISKQRTKLIKKVRMNTKLAEFVGIILGDGTISKYFIRISLNSLKETDYANYISKLVNELFGIESSITKEKNKNTLNVKFYSKNLVDFLKNKLNLPLGDKIKNRAKIPQIIFSDKILMLSCLRGLVDSDGSINPRRVYFYNSNVLLMNQVTNFCKKNKIFTSFYKNTIGTSNKLKVNEYLKLIGTSKNGSVVYR